MREWVYAGTCIESGVICIYGKKITYNISKISNVNKSIEIEYGGRTYNANVYTALIAGKEYEFALCEVSLGQYAYFTKLYYKVNNEPLDGMVCLVFLFPVTTVILTFLAWLTSGWKFGLPTLLVMIALTLAYIIIFYLYVRSGFVIDYNENKAHYIKFIKRHIVNLNEVELNLIKKSISPVRDDVQITKNNKILYCFRYINNHSLYNSIKELIENQTNLK